MATELLGSREIIGRFYQRLEVMGPNMGWPGQIGFASNSTQKREVYRFAGMAPAMRQWVDGRKKKRLSVNGIEVINELFEATLTDNRDNFRRDKTGQLDVRISDLVTRTLSHWRQLLTTLIINGTSTTIYDGQNFFSASHSEGDSGTQTNLLTNSDYSELNVATPANPTGAEMADAILKVVNHFYGYLDDVGEPLNEEAMQFLVMVPVNMAPAARIAVNSNLLNKAAGSLDNPLMAQDNFSVEVAANTRLTATDEFYAFRTDAATKPFILQDEYGVEMSAKAEGSEYEHDTNEWEFGVKASRNVGYGIWSQAIKATLS